MEGSRVSDFSIERILSHQLGHKLQPMMDFSSDGYLHPVPVPVPVPVPGCLQYRGGMSFGEAFYPYGGGFHHTNIYPNQGAYVTFSSQDSADAHQLAGYHGYHHAHQLAGYHGYHRQQHPQPRQKARMRTVFTDSQTKRLEALFELTDYPTVEVRAEVARSTGLSEETVRVWFKNRRARRKRQRSGSKVKSPPVLQQRRSSSPPSSEPDRPSACCCCSEVKGQLTESCSGALQQAGCWSSNIT